jgi:hypothetical protein
MCAGGPKTHAGSRNPRIESWPQLMTSIAIRKQPQTVQGDSQAGRRRSWPEIRRPSLALVAGVALSLTVRQLADPDPTPSAET